MTSTTYITLSMQELEAVANNAALTAASTALNLAGVYIKQTDAAKSAGVSTKTIRSRMKAGELRTHGTRVLAGDVLEMGK